jgi:hypothetical protein
MLTRLAVGLEPLNALDAAHRSPRFVQFLCAKIRSPVGLATRRPIKRNKERSKRSKCFPKLLNQSHCAGSRLATLTSTNGTRVFDKPSPKRRCRLIMDCRFICAVCFGRACKGDVLQATVYGDDQRLSWGQVHVTCLNQYDHGLLHA